MKENVQLNPEILKELIVYRMPFGKYKEWLITDLPVSYLEWFVAKGMPDGKLGMLLNTMYEIRLNDLMYLIDELKRIYRR